MMEVKFVGYGGGMEQQPLPKLLRRSDDVLLRHIHQRHRRPRSCYGSGKAAKI